MTVRAALDGSTAGDCDVRGATCEAATPGGIRAIYEPIEGLMQDLEMEIDRLVQDAPPGLGDGLAHCLKGGGKRLRPALVLLAGSLFPGKSAPLVSMALGYELLHTATLVHDDTIDNAVTRRGVLTVNRIWGNPNAVILGDYLSGCSALMAGDTENLRAMEIFARALGDLCSGAIAEQVGGVRRSRVEYFATISRKTASLFSAATESGAVLSRAPARAVRALKSYGYNLGMAFQTIDDIHDFAGDLSHGGITLPAILLLEQPENRWVDDVLDKDLVTGLDLLIEMVEDSAVLDDCYRIARGFCAQACADLECLPQNRVSASLRDLVEYVAVQRPAQSPG